MADPIVKVDPRIYGGDAPTGNAVPEFDPMGTAPVQPTAPAPERVSQDQIGAGTQSAAVGINTAALNAREVSSVGTSALAAAKTWSPVRVWDYINMPHFDQTPDFDAKPYVNSVPFVMSDDEQRFMAQSRSPDEFSYRLQATQDQRKLYEQMGDHSLISTLVGFADPGYLALDLASLGVGGAAMQLAGAGSRAARIGAGIATATTTFGLGEVQAQVVPMSDSEIILPALMSGAAGAMFYRPKKGLVPHDPEYPTGDLTKAVQDVSGNTMGMERRIEAEAGDVARSKPTVAQATEVTAAGEKSTAKVIDDAAVAADTKAAQVRPTEPAAPTLEDIPSFSTKERGPTADELFRNHNVTPEDTANAVDSHTFLGNFENDPHFGPVIRTLRDSAGEIMQQLKVVKANIQDSVSEAFYYRGNHTVYVPRTGPYATAKVALHEVVHGLTVHKLEYGLANPASAHGRLVRDLEQLRENAKSQYARTRGEYTPAEQKYIAYFVKNPEEFVAGLFAGEKGGLPKLLTKTAGMEKKNALGKMVDTVRKMLGLAPSHSSALTEAIGLTDNLINTPLAVTSKEIKSGVNAAESVPLATGTPTMGTPPTGTAQQQAATIVKRMESNAAKAGKVISWSLHKTMSNISTAGKKIADLLVDDPINMTGNSVVSQKQAIRSDLSQLQYVYEEGLKAEMAKRGAGLFNRIRHPGKSALIQRGIEREVYDELQRRWAVGRRGGNINDPSVNPEISKMATAHDAATARASGEMKSAGVEGADAFETRAGYATRKWSVTQIETAERSLQAAGLTEKQAKGQVRDVVKDAIMRANPDWESQTAHDVASAILDRARRKGYFEDQALRGHVGDAGAKEIRDILSSSGASQDRINKAIEVITGVTDEAGKPAVLKHRIDMDMNASISTPDGKTITIADLLDTNVARNLDTYLDNAAGNSALARKGLRSTSDITKLRTEFLHGVESEAKRKNAASLFDNTVASIKGQPVGEEVADGMRRLAAVTQMVGLSSSGLWQVTEYANAMAKYGLLKTTREIMRTMPVFKQLMTDMHADGGAANLARVLERNSAQDLRIRPLIQKMEDNFEMDLGDHAMLLAQQAKQMVPYINAMHYIHHNQAKVVGNLVADLFEQGANGSVKAREALAKYGLEGHTLDSIASDVKTHGLNTELWSDATWQQVRGPLNKMMDDAVLKNRTGEIPAFAQFSSLGKFIFTFRSFVLGAHNKVLAGTAGREGFGGLGLLMAYQFPLTMLATSANNVVKGKPQDSLDRTAILAVQQMGAMGLFSDLFGIASGDKQQFGASGLMAIDRLYKTGSAVATGNFGTAASGAVNSIPLLSIVPGVKAFAETLKTPPHQSH